MLLLFILLCQGTMAMFVPLAWSEQIDLISEIYNASVKANNATALEGKGETNAKAKGN